MALIKNFTSINLNMVFNDAYYKIKRPTDDDYQKVITNEDNEESSVKRYRVEFHVFIFPNKDAMSPLEVLNITIPDVDEKDLNRGFYYNWLLANDERFQDAVSDEEQNV